MLAEQFGEAVEMQAITRAARYGRMTGTAVQLYDRCGRQKWPVYNLKDKRIFRAMVLAAR
jgi:hypothetical protein